jgi:hypothetical protein
VELDLVVFVAAFAAYSHISVPEVSRPFIIRQSNYRRMKRYTLKDQRNILSIHMGPLTIVKGFTCLRASILVSPYTEYKDGIVD